MLYGPGQMNWIDHFLFLNNFHVCPVSLTELKTHRQHVEVQQVQIQLRQLSMGWAAKLVPHGGVYCWKPEGDWWKIPLRQALHSKLTPTGQSVEASSPTVTEERRGSVYSFHHPMHLLLWDVEVNWQLIIPYTVTFHDGRAKGTRAALQ